MCEEFKVKHLGKLPMDRLMNDCCDSGKCYIKEYANGDSYKELLKVVTGILNIK